MARTNVAPLRDPPETPVLHAFSHVVPAPSGTRPTLVVAGAGEVTRGGTLKEEYILRLGETSAAAMREKAAYVMDVMGAPGIYSTPSTYTPSTHSMA